MAIYESKYTRAQLDEGIGAGYVPTLQAAPTSSTTSYTRSDLPSGSQTVSFVVGQMCRVAVTGGYDFYQLKNISSNTATWEKEVNTDTNTIPQGYCDTAANTRDKVVTCTDYVATANSYIMILMKNANSYSTNNSTIRLNINGTGNKNVYINGTSSSSSSNKTLPSGSYLVYYDGTNYYFRTDGKITGNITGDAATVNGKTVDVNVPSNAVFTDTTYSVMGASGSGHASGLVPDPGSTAGTTKFLREDGTWQVPTVDVSGKEDKMTVVKPGAVTSLSPAINTLTYIDNVNTLAVTLPQISDTTKVQTLVLRLNMGTTPNLSFTAQGGYIEYAADFEIQAQKGYEISCMRFYSGTYNFWDIVAHEVDYYRGQ